MILRTCQFRRWLALVTSTALLFASVPAGADVSKKSLADSLYDEGMALMEQGKIPEACKKFAASQDTDPGLGTLINLAECHEKDRKFASALGEFNEAASQASKAGKRDLEKFARDHLLVVEKQIHKLVLQASMVDGLEIKIDGVAIPLTALGSGIPVDSGEHVVSAGAKQKKDWSDKVQIAVGPGTTNLKIPALEDRPADAVVAGPGADTGAKPTDTTKLIVGASVAGVGLISVGVGIYYQFGVAADRKKASDAAAVDPALDPTQRLALRDTKLDEAKQASTLGIVFLSLGGVALAVGTVLIITSLGSSGTPAKAAHLQLVPTVGPKANGLSLVGIF